MNEIMNKHLEKMEKELNTNLDALIEVQEKNTEILKRIEKALSEREKTTIKRLI